MNSYQQVGNNRKFNDCMRNTTAVCNPRQNSVQEKIQSKTKFSWKKDCQKKNSQIFSQTEFCLRLHFVSD